MSEKKMVRRSVVIGLGIICIALVIVSLVEAFAYYAPIINDKDNKISSLNSQVVTLNESLNNQILQKNYTIWEQNNTISSLEIQLADLQKQTKDIHILGTGNSPYFFVINVTDYVQAIAPHIQAGSGDVNASSGYVVVWVSSNNNSTYASVFTQVNATDSYYQTINVGSEGIAIFPIPVASYVDVDVGVSTGSATVTWTAMYVN